jgi:hypothetical protein
LEKVDNFTVSNEFGSILFLGQTDVTSVDLQEVVTIEKGSVEVYDDEKHHLTKPSVG